MRYEYHGKELRPTLEIYHDLIPYIAGISEHDFYMDMPDFWGEVTGFEYATFWSRERRFAFDIVRI